MTRSLSHRTVVFVLAMALAAPAAAQAIGDSLKRTVRNAATSEVQRRADQETRRITRCALGDERCIREAQQRGERVETYAGAGASASAGTGPGAKTGPAQHPLVPHYEGAERLRHEAEEFTDYDLRTGKAKSAGTRTVEGRLTRLTYQAPKDRAALEVFRNYEASLRQAGYQILFSCARAECGDIRKDIESGPRYMVLYGGDEHRYLAARRTRAEGDVHVALFVTRNESGGPARGRAMIQLDVIESKPMEERMTVVDSDALRGELARSGRATLYGIQFDFDRDTLRPDSAEQIAQIARLLQAETALSVRVVGHTDAQGAAAYNLDLSRRRAQRIVDALAGEHRIARGRMQAEGLGATQPVAGNDTEDGRARNRRVEIIKR